MTKRIWRNDMPQHQREKIAFANTGKHVSPETRRKISDGLTRYWAGLPFKPTATSGTTEPPTPTTQNNTPLGY